jgi:DNA-binding transcriptional MocR family regulator
VAYTPGNAFFIDSGGEHCLRLSFSSVAADRVGEGVRRLAEVVREAMSAPARPTAAAERDDPLV